MIQQAHAQTFPSNISMGMGHLPGLSSRALASRTTDPEAAQYDKAKQLVLLGLRRARNGSIKHGLPLIACAFLLDSRSIQFKPVLQYPEDVDATRSTSAYLDMILLQELIDYDDGDNIASQVLMIYAAIVFGRAEGGRTRIRQALRISSDMINDIDNDISLEDPDHGLLGGSLNRVTLHHMRSTLFLSSLNPEAAVKELTLALQLNPKLTKFQCERAVLCAIISSKSDNELMQDFRNVILHAHPDGRELRDAYAWLAKLLLRNSHLGSYEEAHQCIQKNRLCNARYQEIYGSTTSSAIESEVENIFRELRYDDNHQVKMKDLSSDVALPPDATTNTSITNMNLILLDGRDATETRRTETMDAASTHKSVYLELVADTWRDGVTGHAKSPFTNLNSSLSKSPSIPFDESSRPVSDCHTSKARNQLQLDCIEMSGVEARVDEKSSTGTYGTRHGSVVSRRSLVQMEQQILPRKPIVDELHVWELANRRMRLYLAERYRVDGQDFSRWWHEMARERKTDLLKRITKNTIPTKARSVTRSMTQSASVMKIGDPKYTACVLSEWCIERILSPCKCTRHWHKETLVHDMRYHLMEDRAEAIEYQLCVTLAMQRFLPSSDQDEPRLLRPPNDSDTFQTFQRLHPNGTLHQNAVASIKTTGLVPAPLKEKFPFELSLHRDWYRFSLYCLLFECFDEHKWHTSSYPLGRLRGCESCMQGCENDESVQCQKCKITWWCSGGCRKVSTHGKRCPFGRPVALKVSFR